MIHSSAGATIQSRLTLMNEGMNSNAPPAKDFNGKQKAVPLSALNKIFFFPQNKLSDHCSVLFVHK